MSVLRDLKIDRRSFLVGSTAIAASVAFSGGSRGAAVAGRQFTLTAAPKRLPFVGAPYPDTDVWSYSASVPGPEVERFNEGTL